jgi:hypothetical protein
MFRVCPSTVLYVCSISRLPAIEDVFHDVWCAVSRPPTNSQGAHDVAYDQDLRVYDHWGPAAEG